MDIAALSVSMSQSQLMNDVSVAMMSKALDTAEVTSDGLTRLMESSVNPLVGQNIDIRL